MGLEVVPVGTAGTHAGAGRPCSGYLVRSGDTRVLLDAGNGSTTNLLTLLEFHELDAVVVSHRHLDHCVDLVGMYYALRFGGPVARSVPLLAAPEVVGQMTSMLSGDSAMGFTEVFRHQQFGFDERVEVGGLTIDSSRSLHPVPTLSLRITDGDRTLCYSSDSAGGDGLVAAAHGADVLLCEATWQGDGAAYPAGIHMTAREAAVIAERAEVDRLVLTHVLGSLDRADSVAEAAEVRESVAAAMELEPIAV